MSLNKLIKCSSKDPVDIVNDSCRNGISVTQISSFLRTISVSHVYDISDTTLFILSFVYINLCLYSVTDTVDKKKINGVKAVLSV